MSAATTRIDWRRSCFGILKMTKLRFDLLIIAMILCLQVNLCCGEEKNDTNKPEEGQVNVINKCAVEANEQLKVYVNDSLSLCSSPAQDLQLLTMVELCQSFNGTYKLLCEMSNVNQLNVTRQNFCDDKFTTNSTSVLPQNINNKEACLKLCVNNSEPKTFSLCLLTRLALETSIKPVEPIVVTTGKPSVTTVEKSTKVDDVSPKLSTVTAKSSSPSVINEKTSDANVITPTKDVDDEEQSKFSLSPLDGDLGEDSNDAFDLDDADEGQVEKTAPSGKEIPAVKEETKTNPGQEKSTFSFGNPDDGSGNFFIYFLTVVVLCIIGYVLYHNKKKVIALIVEGRQERRRRPNTNLYRKLDSNLEEVMQSSGNGAETNGAKRNSVIY